jgi:hypothetical protein
MEQSSSWELIVSQLRNFPYFKEPEGSLSCSQKPVIGPYHEPDELSPHLPTLFPYLVIYYQVMWYTYFNYKHHQNIF